MKQYFTGFFTAVCLTASIFLFIGANEKQENIILSDEYGTTMIAGGGIIISDKNNSAVLYIGNGDDGGGIEIYDKNKIAKVKLGISTTSKGYIATKNSNNKFISMIGENDRGGGIFSLNNEKEDVRVIARIDSKDSGEIETYNHNTVRTTSIGSINKHHWRGDGGVVLFDRYGDQGWFQTGKE